MTDTLQQYAERKMPLFNLVVSIWTHNFSLLETIGVGFTESVFTHTNGLCSLNAKKEEIVMVSNRVLELIKTSPESFGAWYKQAKNLNKKADELLAQYNSNESLPLNLESYKKAKQIFVDNFGFCTILPYWVLYGINQALERGESRESFGDILSMYEELKSETRYPQLVQTIISRYFNKASQILGVSLGLVSCVHPEELEQIISGDQNVISVAELTNRMNWCAITRADKPLKVNFSYDKNGFSRLLSPVVINDVKEFKGSVAFKGVVRGRIKITNTIDDIKKFEEGDIMVSIQSSPALMPAIMKSSAIITDEGGIMCHAAIVSRELKKPCIIGTKIATKVLKDGDEVEVDAERGIVKILKRKE